MILPLFQLLQNIATMENLFCIWFLQCKVLVSRLRAFEQWGHRFDTQICSSFASQCREFKSEARALHGLGFL